MPAQIAAGLCFTTLDNAAPCAARSAGRHGSGGPAGACAGRTSDRTEPRRSVGSTGDSGRHSDGVEHLVLNTRIQHKGGLGKIQASKHRFPDLCGGKLGQRHTVFLTSTIGASSALPSGAL